MSPWSLEDYESANREIVGGTPGRGKTAPLGQAVEEQTANMMFPVRCAHCSGVYDLGSVEVTARYADCSMWNAPCCRRQVDDRGETGWKSRGDYTRIERRSR